MRSGKTILRCSVWILFGVLAIGCVTTPLRPTSPPLPLPPPIEQPDPLERLERLSEDLSELLRQFEMIRLDLESIVSRDIAAETAQEIHKILTEHIERIFMGATVQLSADSIIPRLPAAVQPLARSIGLADHAASALMIYLAINKELRLAEIRYREAQELRQHIHNVSQITILVIKETIVMVNEVAQGEKDLEASITALLQEADELRKQVLNEAEACTELWRKQ